MTLRVARFGNDFLWGSFLDQMTCLDEDQTIGQGNASSGSWVTRMVLASKVRSRAPRSARVCARLVGSSADNGFSSNNGGSVTRALARLPATYCELCQAILQPLQPLGRKVVSPRSG